jgi:hypothetical protein
MMMCLKSYALCTAREMRIYGRGISALCTGMAFHRGSFFLFGVVRQSVSGIDQMFCNRY